MGFDFEKLEVWQKAVNFSTEVYQASKTFPKEELFGLTMQLRRSAVSVALNIAEGAGRHHKPEFIRFLRVARGSLYEVVTALVVSLKLELISEDTFQGVYDESNQIAKMINRLIGSLQETSQREALVEKS